MKDITRNQSYADQCQLCAAAFGDLKIPGSVPSKNLYFNPPKTSFWQYFSGSKKAKQYECKFLEDLEKCKKQMKKDIALFRTKVSELSLERRFDIKKALLKKQLAIIELEKQVRASQKARRYRQQLKVAFLGVLGGALLLAASIVTGGAATPLLIAGLTSSFSSSGWMFWRKHNLDSHQKQLEKKNKLTEMNFENSIKLVDDMSIFVASDLDDMSDFQFFRYAELLAQGASPEALSGMLRALATSEDVSVLKDIDEVFNLQFSHKGHLVPVRDLQNEMLAKRYAKTY